ncbi:MAG: hypothetical protein IH950_06115 [Bacteroidetes bacterium]|nr:hypothetical protein [Bacteroidota bacterium]
MFVKKLEKRENVIVDFIQNDFFKFEADNSSGFDVVYDYVTYIAIYPAKREEYVNLIKIFSKCSRVIIAPWFPVEERGRTSV